MNYKLYSGIALTAFTLLATLGGHAESAESVEFEDEAWQEWQAEFEELERELEAWERSVTADPGYLQMLTVEGGLGYDDNVLLSAVDREGSAFLLTGLDYFLWSGARPAGGESSLFFYGSNKAFLRGSRFSDERLATLNARVTAETAPDWSVILPFDIVLFDQLADVSTRDVPLDPVRVRGGRISFQPGLSLQATEAAEWRGRVIARHGFLSQPLDDFRELGAGLSFDYSEDANTDLELDFSLVHRRYASRQALEADGEPIQGRRLEFLIPKAEGALKRSWGADQRWRSRTSGGFEINRDNGGGYFDFMRPFAAQRISYQSRAWGTELAARISRHSFSERTAPGDGSGPRLRRNTVDLRWKGEYTVNSMLGLTASFNHERVETNERDAGYRVNRIQAGVEVAF